MVTTLPLPPVKVVFVRRASGPASVTDADEAASPAELDAKRFSKLPTADEPVAALVPPRVTLPPVIAMSGDVVVLVNDDRWMRSRLNSDVIVLLVESSRGPESVTLAGETTSLDGAPLNVSATLKKLPPDCESI